MCRIIVDQLQGYLWTTWIEIEMIKSGHDVTFQCRHRGYVELYIYPIIKIDATENGQSKQGCMPGRENLYPLCRRLGRSRGRKKKCLPHRVSKGPGVAQWLKHCATSRKVSGSIPGGVALEFVRSCRRNRALGSTQPLKMSTVKTLGGKDGRCVRVTTLPPSCAECRDDPGTLTSWNPNSHIRLEAENFYLYRVSKPRPSMPAVSRHSDHSTNILAKMYKIMKVISLYDEKLPANDMM